MFKQFQKYRAVILWVGLVNGEIYFYKAYSVDDSENCDSGLDVPVMPIGGAWRTTTLDYTPGSLDGIMPSMGIDSTNQLYPTWFKGVEATPEIQFRYFNKRNATLRDSPWIP